MDGWALRLAPRAGDPPLDWLSLVPSSRPPGPVRAHVCVWAGQRQEELERRKAALLESLAEAQRQLEQVRPYVGHLFTDGPPREGGGSSAHGSSAHDAATTTGGDAARIDVEPPVGSSPAAGAAGARASAEGDAVLATALMTEAIGVREAARREAERRLEGTHQRAERARARYAYAHAHLRQFHLALECAAASVAHTIEVASRQVVGVGGRSNKRVRRKPSARQMSPSASPTPDGCANSSNDGPNAPSQCPSPSPTALAGAHSSPPGGAAAPSEPRCAAAHATPASPAASHAARAAQAAHAAHAALPPPLPGEMGTWQRPPATPVGDEISMPRGEMAYILPRPLPSVAAPDEAPERDRATPQPLPVRFAEDIDAMPASSSGRPRREPGPPDAMPASSSGRPRREPGPPPPASELHAEGAVIALGRLEASLDALLQRTAPALRAASRSASPTPALAPGATAVGDGARASAGSPTPSLSGPASPRVPSCSPPLSSREKANEREQLPADGTRSHRPIVTRPEAFRGMPSQPVDAHTPHPVAVHVGAPVADSAAPACAGTAVGAAACDRPMRESLASGSAQAGSPPHGGSASPGSPSAATSTTSSPLPARCHATDGIAAATSPQPHVQQHPSQRSGRLAPQASSRMITREEMKAQADDNVQRAVRMNRQREAAARMPARERLRRLERASSASRVGFDASLRARSSGPGDGHISYAKLRSSASASPIGFTAQLALLRMPGTGVQTAPILPQTVARGRGGATGPSK